MSVFTLTGRALSLANTLSFTILPALHCCAILTAAYRCCFSQVLAVHRCRASRCPPCLACAARSWPSAPSASAVWTASCTLRRCCLVTTEVSLVLVHHLMTCQESLEEILPVLECHFKGCWGQHARPIYLNDRRFLYMSAVLKSSLVSIRRIHIHTLVESLLSGAACTACPPSRPATCLWCCTVSWRMLSDVLVGVETFGCDWAGHGVA